MIVKLFAVHIVLFRVLPEIHLSLPSTKFMQNTVMKINETNEEKKEKLKKFSVNNNEVLSCRCSANFWL
jgi:hypothetical protein